MGVPLTKDFVATVRAAGDIVRLVGDYVALKQAGSRLKGLCPFHQEKTPSFSVDPERGLFYCFGCQAGGDVFHFVMLYEQVEFPGAVEFLAKRWGVPLPTADAPGDRIRRRVEEANRAAEAWFRARLLDPEGGRSARDYLSRRGVRPETAETLGLGFAPESWDALLAHLRGRGFRPEEIERAGLALKRKSGDGHYDRFRDRLVFPIRDLHGVPVAFGGRALGDGEPKYLNSPETPAYVKGEHLYGLDFARDVVRREGYAILVEGYLDLAAVRQAGLEQVVASLGTAFTPAQARLIGRFARRVVVAYDGDEAGVAAAARAADSLLAEGIEVRIAELPEGSDPDDLVRKEGGTAFAARILEAPGWFEFLLGRETRARDLDRPEEKIAAINALLPRLVRLSAIERAEWAGRMAEALRVDDALLAQELREAVRAGKAAVRQRVAGRGRPRLLDLQIVSILLEDGGARKRFREEVGAEEIRGMAAERVVEAILRLESENGNVDYPNVTAVLEREEDRDLLHLAAFREGRPFEPGEAGYLACLEAIRRETLRREGRDVERLLRETGETEGDALLARRMQIARQIDAMS